MNFVLQPWQLLVVILTGWLNPYSQNTPPNRNYLPALKLRTCVGGLFPLVDSRPPAPDAEVL